MKKLLLFLISGTIILFGVSTQADIQNSAHDFAQAGGFNEGGEICVACHTPHNADTSVADAPLWNHEVTAELNFDLYDSDTLNAVPGQPDGTSKLCLSCHDGTIALDSYGGGPPVTVTGPITGDANLTTNLADDHPISFVYNTDLFDEDDGLYNPAIQLTELGGTIEADLLFGTAGAASVECASCHDVHNQDNNTSLLRIENDGSDLCLTCHNK